MHYNLNKILQCWEHRRNAMLKLTDLKVIHIQGICEAANLILTLIMDKTHTSNGKSESIKRNRLTRQMSYLTSVQLWHFIKRAVPFPTRFLRYTRHGCCCHPLPTSIWDYTDQPAIIIQRCLHEIICCSDSWCASGGWSYHILRSQTRMFQKGSGRSAMVPGVAVASDTLTVFVKDHTNTNSKGSI